MQIHENIKFIRQLKGWSQEEMADKLGMSLNGYGSIERGETDVQLSRLENIASVFELNLLQLLGLNEKNIFNSTGENSTQNQYWYNNSSETEKDLKYKLDESILQNEQYQKEIAYLKQEIAYLKEIIELKKGKN